MTNTTDFGPPRLIPADHLSRKPVVATRRSAEGAKGPSLGVEVKGLWARLRRDVEGEVRFDDGTRGLYAQDASNYLHVPIGVVIPKSKEDVIAALAACRSFGAPVVARAGGTGLAGQTANEAVVIDCSKYLNAILELDANGRRARVEPGVICDQLVDAAKPYGLTWGPKPATHDHCAFGGMLANNCGGMHAQYAGIAVHNVEAMDVALYDGTRMTLGWMDDVELERRARADGREGRIYAKLGSLRQRYGERIANGFPKLPRRVSGYNLDELLPKGDGRFNLARALVGSEGTCVTTLEATLRLVDEFPERVVVALGYEDVFRAGDHVPEALEFEPLAVEGMDQRLYEHVVKKHMRQEKHLDLLPDGHGWLLVQIGSNELAEAKSRAGRLVERLRATRHPPLSIKLITSPEEQKFLWDVRESGLGATAFVPGEPDTWPGFEDSAVRPEQVGEYLRDLRQLFSKHGYNPSLYGHFGMGCVHCRVDFVLTNASGIANYRRFMEEAAQLVTEKYDGSISGEHGDGQSRGELLVRMFGPELIQAFREFKALWDPDGKMNPGRLVDARPLDADLRLGAAYAPRQPETHFKFPEDGGSFAKATLRCVGVGKCRRLAGSGEQDTMCPSFMVTREEKHSTRGRAHLLWEMLRGDGTPIKGMFRDENVKESLDLCLSCKGCKGDCPVNVDIATYKAEFLSHYYEGRMRPRHAYAFGWIDRWARLGSHVPGLVNLATQTPGVRVLARFIAGMSQKRSVPVFAPETFRAWFESREDTSIGADKVLLFPDTFNDHFHPSTARDAVEVLEHAGFDVVIPEKALCCGRPLYDYGMLDRAKSYLESILTALKPHIDAETPIVVLEPSCCAVFRDELPALLPNRPEAKRLSELVMTFSEFMMKHGKKRIPKLRRKAVAQGHCHHKAVMKFDAEKAAMQEMGLDVEVLEAGCCGMAGSFGFEAERYAASQAIGERALLPQIRAEEDDTIVIADGFSCRTQIAQGTRRHALHLAEVMRLALSEGEDGPPRGTPAETAAVKSERAAVHRSMLVTAVGLATIIVALVAIFALSFSGS
ncbi:MAG TPA: FAD-binding and (Fe-S)-binding domain-containing protein [Polyangiaceae bacterium]|nr:FAD-binding and (Fe-S)-binding domain-containing protein [Polyangiaceae bacterium]